MKAHASVSESAALSPSEIQMIDICVRIAQFVGLPKSVGELYGLLFISPVPLPLDVLAGRLNLSKGSTSQGLKYLRAYGAIKPSYVAADRRDHYVAETEVKRLLSGYLRERVEPGVADLAERLFRIEQHTAELAPAKRRVAQERLEKLKHWQRQAQKILPLANTFLGK